MQNVSLAVAVTSTTSTDFIGKTATIANCEHPSTTITGVVTEVAFTSNDDGSQRVKSLSIQGVGSHSLYNGDKYSLHYYWNLIDLV